MLTSFITKSIVIATPISLLVLLAFINLNRGRIKKRSNQITESWPEAIDHLISGLHAGRSLTESLVGLADRGPTFIRSHFREFKDDVLQGLDFESSLLKVRGKLSHHGSDQVIEALLIAKNLGGGELINLLRTVGDFQRQDLILNREIEIKQGWIKNSAHLSAAAPWFLLLILSTQSSTAIAFSSSSGMMILFTGFALTIIAYYWMNHLSRLPDTPRVFTTDFESATKHRGGGSSIANRLGQEHIGKKLMSKDRLTKNYLRLVKK